MGAAPEKETCKKQARVGDGTPGPGRKKGVPNKTTTVLKEAIMLAAEQVGVDGKGKDGLTGYLRGLAVKEPKAFAVILGKTLPLDTRLANPDGTPLQALSAAPVFNVSLSTTESPKAK